MYVTYSLFDCNRSHIRWMFAQVGVGNSELKRVPGVQFSKIMGHGGFGGFSIWPNFKRYSFLVVWDSEKSARDFFQHSEYFDEWQSRAESWYTFILSPIKAHGKWSGVNPFKSGEEKAGVPIAVLTRAKIRWRKLWVFWRNVPNVHRRMKDYKGMLFANGIGEYPLFQQATLSLWKDTESMMDFAYHDPLHANIVHRTRKENWYSEELFGRFHVLGYFSNEKGSILAIIDNLDKLNLQS